MIRWSRRNPFSRFVWVGPRAVGLSVALATVLGISSAALAQDQNLTRNSAPSARETPTLRGADQLSDRVPNNFGTSDGIDLWIPAYQFSPINASDGLLQYNGSFYYYKPAAVVNGRYFAFLPLPQGASINGYRPFWYDNDAVNNFAIGIEKVFDDTTATPTSNFTFLSTFAPTTQSANFQNQFVSLSHTVDLREPSSGSVTMAQAADFYTFYIDMPNSTDVRFKGVRVFWFRQVSPAPATATFGDVPTSNPQFKFIEALFSAGITGGCQVSPPLYCPNAPLTRGQMAVFLSVALGLHWPPF